MEPKFPARGEHNVKDRHVIFGTLPCVVITSLKADALMAVIAYFDMLMVRRSPARGRRKRVLEEQLRFRNIEKSKVVYLRIQIQRGLFYGKLEK